MRFVIVSFLLLGAAFYFASGGASYRPVENSLQAWAEYGYVRPKMRPDPRPEPRPASEPAPEPAQAARAVSAPETPFAARPGHVETQAPAASEDEVDIRMRAAVNRASLANYGAAYHVPVPTQESRNAPDIRILKNDHIDLHTGPGVDNPVITRLRAGEEVEVLYQDEIGWINLEVVASGQTGWIAAELLE